MGVIFDEVSENFPKMVVLVFVYLGSTCSDDGGW